MVFSIPICYIFCYEDDNLYDACARLSLSLASLPKRSSVYIVTWHNHLLDLISCNVLDCIIHIIDVEYGGFSRSACINRLVEALRPEDYTEYFYLADTDLYFHPYYFASLERICHKLDYRRGDLRIITPNYNVLPVCKLPWLPTRIVTYAMNRYPRLFDWSLPKNFSEILRRQWARVGYAHGCGLVPIRPLSEIGGYNAEMFDHGPEDDLFNKRICFFARLYYHPGTLMSSTFHLPHMPLRQSNSKVNFMYWRNSLSHMSYHGIDSSQIIRK